MQKAYLLVTNQFADNAFSGEGASMYAFRWNSKGHLVAYAVATRSLVMLEITVQTGPIHPQYVVIEATIPDEVNIKTINVSELDSDLRELSAKYKLQTIGDAWLISLESAVLCVPSAVITEELNYLFNPLHPDFQKIKIGER